MENDGLALDGSAEHRRVFIGHFGNESAAPWILLKIAVSSPTNSTPNSIRDVPCVAFSPRRKRGGYLRMQFDLHAAARGPSGYPSGQTPTAWHEHVHPQFHWNAFPTRMPTQQRLPRLTLPGWKGVPPPLERAQDTEDATLLPGVRQSTCRYFTLDCPSSMCYPTEMTNLTGHKGVMQD